MPYLNVMTHIDDREDDELLFDLGGSEHPTVLFLDALGAVLGRHDMGDASPKALGETGAKVKRSEELRKKAEGGDAAARLDLLIAQCDLGVIEYPDLEGAIEGAALSEEQRRAVATLRADATVSDMRMVVRKNPDETSLKLAAEEFLALRKEGARPARRLHRVFFWSVLADHAVEAKDAVLLAEAIEGLRAADADPARLKALEGKRAALEPAK